MNAPRLVDLSKFQKVDVPNFNNNKSFPFTAPKKKWNINKILLIGFTIFTIFFLYNCRYGIFKCPNPELMAYS